MFRAKNYLRPKICLRKLKVFDVFASLVFWENFLGVFERLNVAKAEEDVTE